MTLYKSVIIPQLSYACNALYEDDPKGEEIQKSCLYQCLKVLLNIRGNVKRERLFWSLNLNINGKLKPKTKEEITITELLSIPTIKLRVGWLFNRFHERKWNCNHEINSKDIILLCKKLDSWRAKWKDNLKLHNLDLSNTLLNLTTFKDKNYLEAQTISKMINESINEMIKAYFQ